MAHGFAAAEDVGRLLLEIARALGRGHHQRAAAVADDAAVEQMQRRRDDARGHHVLDRDRVAILGRRIHRGVQAHRDRDFGELLGSRAVLVHMALRHHRVGPDRGRPERHFILIARVAAAASAAGADRKALRGRGRAVYHHRDLAQPGRDRGGGMRGMGDERRAADRGRVDKVGRQVHVVAEPHDPHPAHPDPGRADAVDVLDLEPGVVKRAAHALSHDLEHALVGRKAGRMLVDAGQRGLAA